MKLSSQLLAAGLFSSFLMTSASAQNRTYQVGSLAIDDGAGNTVTISIPSGLSGNYSYVLPTPPSGSVTSGYVATGSVSGQTQYWNGTYWTPTNLLSTNNTSVALGLSSVPGSFAFPITLGGHIGPSTDNTINIGDATHRINTIYVSNIVGASGGGGGGSSDFTRAGTTISPTVAGDNISTTGNLGAGTTTPSQKIEVKNGNLLLSNTGTAKQLQLQGTGAGTTTFEAGAQGATTINYILPISQGAVGSMLTNGGTGTLNWSNIGQVKFARKSADQDFTSTSLTNDNTLAIAMGANETYTFDAFFPFSDPSTNGITYRFAFTAPAGASLKFGFADATTSASTNATVKSASGAETYTLSLNNTTEVFVRVTGIVVNGGTAGNLQLQVRKVGGGAPTDPVRLSTNAYLKAVRVQ